MSISSHYSSTVYAQQSGLQSLPSQGNLLASSNNTVGSKNPLMGLDFLKSSGIFNGSSFIATAGISTVNGIKVTGVNLPENNKVAVMLTATNNSNAANLARPFPSSVTVIALRIALSHDDLTSLMSAAAQSSRKSGGGFMNSLSGQQQGTNNTSADYSLPQQNNTSSLNPLSFLKNMQIGSTSLVNADWKVPHIVKMGLSGNKVAITPVADLVLVEVVPYTGESSLLTRSLAP